MPAMAGISHQGMGQKQIVMGSQYQVPTVLALRV
jgi:hypothetical protein